MEQLLLLPLPQFELQCRCLIRLSDLLYYYWQSWRRYGSCCIDDWRITVSSNLLIDNLSGRSLPSSAVCAENWADCQKVSVHSEGKLCVRILYMSETQNHVLFCSIYISISIQILPSPSLRSFSNQEMSSEDSAKIGINHSTTEISKVEVRDYWFTKIVSILLDWLLVSFDTLLKHE